MLKQKYGRIINITSPVATLGFAGQTNYGASKRPDKLALQEVYARRLTTKKNNC